MFICKKKTTKLAIIAGKPGSHHVIDATSSPSKRVIRKLLGLIVGQAIMDGMGGLSIGVDESGSAMMKYYRESPSSQVCESWDMTPPPAEFYPYVFQTIIDMVSLEPSLPMKGSLMASYNGQDIPLYFTASALSSFELSWTLPEVDRLND